jgi:hypothetical protein
VRDVTNQFHVTDINPDELAQQLIGVFNHATYSALDRIDIPNSEAPKVQIYFNAAGQIRKVASSLTDNELRPIVSRLADLFLGPTHRKVQRFIGFASAPVTGTWACEALTITVAPPEAPRPGQFLADYPYILEVSFEATDDMLVNIPRAYRLRARYELLLSLFTSGIKTSRSQHRMLWGMDAERIPPRQLKPHLVQEVYAIPGFPSVVEGRTPLADPLVKLVPDSEYFGRYGRTRGEDFDLPQSLEAWMNTAVVCEEQVRQRLFRTAYWLNHAHEVFSLSQSASLVAAVQAIEVLLPAAKGEVCQACKRDIAPGPTRKFREFLQKYAPTPDIAERKARDLLYRQRSQLTHGQMLLSADDNFHFGWATPAHAFDMQTLDGALRLTRMSAINWFLAHTGSGLTTAGTRGQL